MDEPLTLSAPPANPLNVPAIDGIRRYVDHGIPPGDFLTGIITNDLRLAVEHADAVNSSRIADYVRHFFNHEPSGCWGSEEKFTAWVEQGGMAGGSK